MEFFDRKRFCKVVCLTTALYMACPAREPEPHVPEWPVPIHRTLSPDWLTPIVASGQAPGGHLGLPHGWTGGLAT